MKVLITGAQFANKGAQSMLYSLVNELNSRYEAITIYYVPLDDYKKYAPGLYRFVVTYDDRAYLDWKHSAGQFLKRSARCAVNSLRIAFRGRDGGVARYSKVIGAIDALIDISGFALSDQFPRAINNRYLRYLEDAEKHGAKVILMPQSFGPFDYGAGKDALEKKIRALLPRADLIFAREKEGKDLLERLYQLPDVRLSPDSVLLASPLDPAAVLCRACTPAAPAVATAHNVGIIPNTQTVLHGDESKILEIYRAAINNLIRLGKQVYIFRHSDDQALCKKIYAMFEGHESVHLILQDMDCLEYSLFVKNFDYVIASRYHAIVHAYKEHVPAVILGWAVKYDELAAPFAQTPYVYDLTRCTAGDIEAAVQLMDSRYAEESDTISLRCQELAQNTCYDLCWPILDRLNGR